MITIRLLLAFLLLFHPVYNANPAQGVKAGDVFVMWNAETPTPGNGGNSASQQVGLDLPGPQGKSPGFAIDGKFSGAPGVFEIDVQVAAVDADANYQTCVPATCQVTTVDATNNTFHVDCTQVKARFVRLLMRSRANSVTITATITG